MEYDNPSDYEMFYQGLHLSEINEIKNLYRPFKKKSLVSRLHILIWKLSLKSLSFNTENGL